MVLLAEICVPTDDICASLSRECQRETGCAPVPPKQLKPTSATVLSAVNKKATR